MFALPQLPRNLAASVRDAASTRPEVRASAMSDLVRHALLDEGCRLQAIAILSERLSDSHPAVRAKAAVCLADLRAADATAALCIAAEDDDPHVREMALSALGEIGDARALGKLRRALRDARPEVRYQAIIAISRFASSNGAVDREELDHALVAAAGDHDPAVQHIAFRIAEERLSQGQAPSDALVRAGKALVDAPQPGHASAALAAAILLAKLDDEAAIKVVLAVVSGRRVWGEAPNKEDECEAVELCGERRLVQAKLDLARRAWGMQSWVQDTCAFSAKIALARMGDARATSELLRDLGSSRRAVREAAVVAAGRARLEAAGPVISRLPPDAVDPELRAQALALLGSGGQAP